jgi:hypothetical protein
MTRRTTPLTSHYFVKENVRGMAHLLNGPVQDTANEFLLHAAPLVLFEDQGVDDRVTGLIARVTRRGPGWEAGRLVTDALERQNLTGELQDAICTATYEALRLQLSLSYLFGLAVGRTASAASIGAMR